MGPSGASALSESDPPLLARSGPPRRLLLHANLPYLGEERLALRHILEGLALWQGQPLCVACDVDGTAAAAGGTRRAVPELLVPQSLRAWIGVHEPPLCGAELDACDTAIGAGVTFPGGNDSSARRCELAAGRYITNKDPDPTEAFLCVAKVGSEGGGPRTADAMVAALSSPLLGTNGYPPGCNQGFLRDDALLVVTLISDQPDEYSSGPADAWLKVLMDAKHQDGEAFQLLVITTDHDIVGGLCGKYVGFVNRLRTFVEIVPHGEIGSICAESYGPFFDVAVAEVLKRCESFVAPQ